MPTEIVRSHDQQKQLAALVAEYEASLPPHLRHDRVPDAGDESNVGILASTHEAASGCVFVSKFDEDSAVIQRLYVRPESRGGGFELRAAYQLYLSLGFTPCEPYGAVSYDNPTYMELQL